MRIRKHARISPLVYAASSLKSGTILRTHFCQLNQSPWDVFTFPPPDYSDPTAAAAPPPPPLYQVHEGDRFKCNGSFSDYNGVDNSVACIKFASSYNILEQNEDFESKGNPGNQVRGSKNSTHYKIKDIKGRVSFSEQQLKKRNSDNTVEKRRPSRPKKPNSSSNPYEFYYYSEFGPSWGKRRGPATKDETESYSSESLKDEAVVMEIDDEDNSPEISVVEVDSSRSEMCNEGLDYLDDDDEEEENNGEFVGNKKRVRKPIKARSLKSLM